MLDYFELASFQLRTWRVAKYNLNFLGFPHTHLLDIFRHSNLDCGLELFIYLFHLTNHDDNPR